MPVRTSIKKLLDGVTHPFGINIERYFGNEVGLKQIATVYKERGVNLLLDVGANTGQYAMSMIKLGYSGKIVSFEPLTDAYETLKKNQLKYSNWQVYERAAIGDYCGKTMINVSANSHSSSILPIKDTHIKAAPSAKYIDQLETTLYTLDSIFINFAKDSDKICLKLDTQGFEDKVLAGASESLQKIDLIQLELSLIPLYEGGKTIEWMLPYLNGLGFEPVFFLPGFIDRTTGLIQQLEALFIKKS